MIKKGALTTNPVGKLKDGTAFKEKSGTGNPLRRVKKRGKYLVKLNTHMVLKENMTAA